MSGNGLHKSVWLVFYLGILFKCSETLLTCSASVSPMGYPEVVDNKINDDGTVTLIVHAVFPAYREEKFFAHEVIIKEETDGSFKYLSNKIHEEGKMNVPEYKSRAEV